VSRSRESSPTRDSRSVSTFHRRHSKTTGVTSMAALSTAAITAATTAAAEASMKKKSVSR
jgi:hypothetical protein